jgi:CRP-like cAMP-binding protein
VDDQQAGLRRLPLFAGLDDETLTRVERVADVIDVPSGTVLTHEGRYEGYFYVVASGAVGIERGGLEVDTIGEGGFFGEIALRDAGPRTATVTAVADSRLVRIANDDLEDLEARSPAIRDALAEAAEGRLHRIDEAAAL